MSGATPPPSRPPWVQDGRKLGRYRLGPSLGRGGMGEVFGAWDTLLDRPVAVKTLNVPHPNAILRFMKEAQLQARVSHPNVCRIFDVDISDNVPFIAMQWVKGPSLFTVAPDLTVREAVEILASVAQAMHAAHRVNLIHRDLKPSNILLEKSSAGTWIPYVADFGLAKDLDEEGLTLGSGVLGTPRYMAPEQFRGQSALIGPRTDVFALGATLASILDLSLRTGVSPDSTRPGARPTGPPFHLRRQPRVLKTILRRCLEERPQDRYPTAGALAEDFRRFLDGEPLVGARLNGLARAKRLIRRHPAWTASLVLTIVLGGGGGLWASRLAGQDRQRATLALHFAQDARELEASLAYESLLPPHDLAPLLDRMTLGLQHIRRDMDELGSEARGPGSLALGRGYLAMLFLEPALEALEQAWAAGYQTPDVAYALCKVHCQWFIRILDQVQLGDRPPAQAQVEHHLREARRYLALSGGATLEWPELCRAKLLIFERRGAEALEEARKVLAQDPWCHEAKVEEAYALESLGYDRQRAGDPGGAMAWYRRAEAAASMAQSVGRSDITCYLASLDWRLHWLENPRLAPAEALAVWVECERLVEVVLAIRPRFTRAISAKVHVLLGRARALKALGRDPRPALARAERYLAGAKPLPAYAWLVAEKRELVRRTKEELGRS